MRTFPDLRFRELNQQSAHAHKLIADERFDEARELLLPLRVKAVALGVPCGTIDWNLAMALDCLGDLERAFEHIVSAVRQDPLHGGFQNSFDAISNRMRAALADPTRESADPSTPRLYDLLNSAGESDVPCHLAMAKYHAATGREGDALKLLDAVTLLSPVSRDAWAQKALLAKAMGDELLWATCEAQAEGIARADVPFGIPGRAPASC